MEKDTIVNLFQKIDFISHAGIPLSWKIECDAVKPEEWDCFATMIMDYQKDPFSKVVGIPRGGLPLQHALEPYVTKGDHPWLVVDDVYTTGTSFREFCTTKDTMWAYKWVVFARKPIPLVGKLSSAKVDINALFTMPEVEKNELGQ